MCECTKRFSVDRHDENHVLPSKANKSIAENNKERSNFNTEDSVIIIAYFAFSWRKHFTSS